MKFHFPFFSFFIVLLFTFHCIAQSTSENTSTTDSLALCAKLDSSKAVLEQDPFQSFLLAKDVYKEANRLGFDYIRAEAQLRIGIYYLQQANYAQALDHFIQTQAYAEQRKNAHLLARVLMNKGNVYYELGQYPTAIANFQKALELANTISDNTIISGCFTNMGNVQVNLGNYKVALDEYKKALDIYVKLQDKKGIAIALSNIGNIYFYQGNFKAAEDYYLKALGIKQELLDVQGMTIALQNLGNLYLQIKNYPKAQKYSEESLELARLLKSKDDKLRASMNLYAIHKRLGDYKTALIYLEYANLLKDSIKNDMQAKELGRLEAKYELEKQEAEINFLKTEKALKDEKNKKAILYRNIIIVVILLLAAVLLSVILYFKNRKIRRINQQLLQQNKEIAQKNETLQILNDEIDQFVYRTSHDLKSPLTSVLGLINIAKLEPNSPALPTYFEKMQESIGKLMLVLHDLSNYARNERVEIQLSNINFKELIRECLENCSNLGQIASISVNISVKHTESYVGDTLRLKILLENLISNALIHHDIHKKDKHININVDGSGAYLEIKISDNGTGIHPDIEPKIFDMFFKGTNASPGSGIGLYIVKRVLRKLNGSITVQSEVGVGSTFTVALPYTTT